MNNTILIDKYLQNEMDAAEKRAFEAQLAIDPELQNEVKIQRQLIEAVVSSGVKLEFAKTMRRRVMFRRTIIWSIAAVMIPACFMLFYRFFDENKKVKIDIAQIAQPFIQPPIPALNVPFTEFSFDASKGDTIFYPTGSILFFPPSALVDENGSVITGTVNVKYREFSDPLDFFVSGIPMTYDSAGKEYNFESSGMCEIVVHKDSKPVFVNKNSTPQVLLSSKNNDPAHNLYYLDTVSRKWVNMGKDKIMEVKNYPQASDTTVKAYTSLPGMNESDGMPVKPVKPRIASDDKQVFSIKIEPYAFEELFAYDKLKFEVVDESTFNSADSEDHWDDVKLERIGKEGIYSITFSNIQRTVTYTVRPVLKGEDYDQALKEFNKKKLAYETAVKVRKAREIAISDSINKEMEKANREYQARIRESDSINALIIARNKELQENATYTGEVMRSFTINQFGIWNCDNPNLSPSDIPIAASFTDSLNNTIPFLSAWVVYKEFNGLMQYSTPSPLKFKPGEKNMIWAVYNKRFYYFTYDDFDAAGIRSGTTTFNFVMRKMQDVKDYAALRRIVDSELLKKPAT
jgi:hypothetical protein